MVTRCYRKVLRSNVALTVLASGVTTSTIVSSDETAFGSNSSNTLAPSSVAGAPFVPDELIDFLRIDRDGIIPPFCFTLNWILPEILWTQGTAIFFGRVCRARVFSSRRARGRQHDDQIDQYGVALMVIVQRRLVFGVAGCFPLRLIHNLSVWCENFNLGSIGIALPSGNLLQILSEEIACFLIVPLAKFPRFMYRSRIEWPFVSPGW